MSLVKWDPLETLSNLQSDIDAAFGRFLKPRGAKNGEAFDWFPAVDIREDAEAYHFDVEVPGMNQNQIKVLVSDDNVLTVKGERKHESERKGDNFHRIEREYGSFLRSFTLPPNAKPNQVNAEYKNGVLKISVAKKENALPKEIAVKAG